jgi:cytosine deaminase
MNTMLLVTNATLADGRQGQRVLIESGCFKAIAADLPIPEGAEVLDAHGYLLSAPFVDAHFHMDATLSHGQPRINQSGTLLEGIAVG